MLRVKLSVVYASLLAISVLVVSGCSSTPVDKTIGLTPAKIYAEAQDEIANGQVLFAKYCRLCHGWPGSKGGAIPNLTYSNEGTFSIFEDIVLKGMYLKKGMPYFGDRLNQQEVKNIKNYILNSSKELQPDGKN